jgi:hypothetical protein
MGTSQKNVIEIPSFPHETNKPPYVVPMRWDKTGLNIEKGLFNYIPLEAKGEKRTGLALSLIIPSDGRDVIYVYDHAKRNDGVFSTSAVPGKVRDCQDEKNVILRDWNRSEVVEIIPCIIDLPGVVFPNNFFWKSVVLTKRQMNREVDSTNQKEIDDVRQLDGSTVPFIALCHARLSTVVSVPADDTKSWTTIVQQKLFPQKLPTTTLPITTDTTRVTSLEKTMIPPKVQDTTPQKSVLKRQ